MNEIKLTPKEWRKARGYSIESVAQTLEVHHTTWKKWEDEPSKMPLGKAYQFCELIDVEYHQVLFLP